MLKENKLNIGFLPILILSVFLMLLSACDDADNDESGNEALPEITQYVSSIVVDNNNIKWIGTSTGLYQTVSGGFKFVDIIGEVEVNALMYETESNLLWVGTTEGLIKVTLSGTEVVSSTSISPNNFNSQNIRAAYIDGASKRWFGTDLGITLNHGDYWKNDSFRINVLSKIFPMDLEVMEVNSISAWEGDYFFATSVGSIYRATEYNPSVDAFTGATQWIAPYNGQNLTSKMNVVFVDSKGNQWMGGELGIQVHSGHDPKNMVDFTYYNDELASNYIHAIAESPDGEIWVGTDLGLSVKNGESWTTITENLPDIDVTAIAFDKADGSAWIGTKKGLVNIK